MPAARMPRPAAAPKPTAEAIVEEVDTAFLESLLGYNARRAWSQMAMYRWPRSFARPPA